MHYALHRSMQPAAHSTANSGERRGGRVGGWKGKAKAFLHDFDTCRHLRTPIRRVPKAGRVAREGAPARRDERAAGAAVCLCACWGSAEPQTSARAASVWCCVLRRTQGAGAPSPSGTRRRARPSPSGRARTSVRGSAQRSSPTRPRRGAARRTACGCGPPRVARPGTLGHCEYSQRVL
jgi:hypothetical protein